MSSSISDNFRHNASITDAYGDPVEAEGIHESLLVRLTSVVATSIQKELRIPV